MKSNTSRLRNFAVFLMCVSASYKTYGVGRAELIRNAVFSNGFVVSQELYDDTDAHLAAVGKVFFESTHLSLNGEIACSTCHINHAGSSDGIPNAAGIRGIGKSVDRLRSGATIVPRNTLGLWGVGAPAQKTYFWDGKLINRDSGVLSQFGTRPPSEDPLVTAVHLPAVEIRETLDEDAFVRANKRESADGARLVYSAILDNLSEYEPGAVEEIASALQIESSDLSFLHVARSVAAFIRSEFRIRTTKLEKFALGKTELTSSELLGAEIFYGKGGCAVCHRGPLFSDQKFHTVPVPPLGFGKNGFGADYGRFNTSLDPRDLYKFRTPILYNVAKTAPYGHGGSMQTLREAIASHVDPLALIDLESLDGFGRHEYSKVLAASDVVGSVQFISSAEIDDLIEFLNTLSF
jgi:cytochrome c peroxidase